MRLLWWAVAEEMLMVGVLLVHVLIQSLEMWQLRLRSFACRSIGMAARYVMRQLVLYTLHASSAMRVLSVSSLRFMGVVKAQVRMERKMRQVRKVRQVQMR